MEQNKTISMRVIDAITLCQLIDEYGEFHQSFMKFLSEEKYQFRAMGELSKMSRNQRCHASKKVKNFYNAYKTIIDTIEQNAGMQSFSFFNYSYVCGSSHVYFKSEKFYQYLLANADKTDKILSVLERLKALGFSEFELNQLWDFSKEVYETKIDYFRYNDLVYLDNLEPIPEYKQGVVKYKTTGSNYKIELRLFSSGIYASMYAQRDRIRLNSLTFDVDRLPKEISAKDIRDEIIGLTTKKQQEYTAIRNSVDLSVGIGDLEYLLIRFNETVAKMESVDSKEKVLEQLRNMHQNLNAIQLLSSAYNQSIIEGSGYITQELLQEEVKKHLKSREDTKIDWC